MKQTTALIFTVVFTLCAPCIITAQDNPEPTTHTKKLTIDEAIINLADERISVRDRAMENLMTRPDLTDDRLAQAFSQVDHPEAFHRLSRVAEHRFFATLGPKLDPKSHASCLGISLLNLSGKADNVIRPLKPGEDKAPPAFLISKTYPGFPAHVYLQPGDLITQLNSKDFPKNFNTDMFIAELQKLKAGESALFTILRGQSKLKVRITLDSRERLTAIYPEHGNHQIFLGMWHKHYKKITEGYKHPAPISVDLNQPHEKNHNHDIDPDD